MSLEQQDILIIDEQIKKKILNEQKEKTDFYNKVIENINESIKKTNDKEVINILNNQIKLIETKIKDISVVYDFYVSETIEFIEKFKKILKIPKQISFMGKIEDTTLTEKINIIENFKNVAKNYIFLENTQTQKCNNCGELLQLEDTDDHVKTCVNCSSHQITQVFSISYRDTSRVNISSKYAYDRKSHFRECINQYQGKQTVFIPDEIYKLLEEKIQFHNLLIGNEKTEKKIRYSKVTKKIILMFLKEMNLSKQYENLNLIYSKITGNKLNDISHLTPSILNDFDLLVEKYDTLFNDISRKNFINTQYVLFQLLKKHGYPCQKEDFANIKTIDRKFFHEHILKTLFQKLGWNYTSIF